MTIKFDSDDNLPLNKMIEIHIMTIVVRAVKNVWKYNIMIELTFLKELMLLKQAKRSVKFVTIGIS